MRDAVTLMRQKIEDPTLAFQDTTMDAVITLAAIEVSNATQTLRHFAHFSSSTEKEIISKLRCTSML